MDLNYHDDPAGTREFCSGRGGACTICIGLGGAEGEVVGGAASRSKPLLLTRVASTFRCTRCVSRRLINATQSVPLPSCGCLRLHLRRPHCSGLVYRPLDSPSTWALGCEREHWLRSSLRTAAGGAAGGAAGVAPVAEQQVGPILAVTRGPHMQRLHAALTCYRVTNVCR